MRWIIRIVIFSLALCFFFKGSLFAAEDMNKRGPKKAKSGKAVKSQILNFEDELITGESDQPEIMSIMQRQDFNFKRLIRLRKNFLHEMKKTTEDIERGRSSY